MYLNNELLRFTFSTYSVFGISSHQVQNWAMHPPSFIIACNVLFLRDDVNFFFNRKACALHVIEDKIVNFFFKTLTSSPFSFFVIFLFSLSLSSPINDCTSWNFNLKTLTRVSIQRWVLRKDVMKTMKTQIPNLDSILFKLTPLTIQHNRVYGYKELKIQLQYQSSKPSKR